MLALPLSSYLAVPFLDTLFIMVFREEIKGINHNKWIKSRSMGVDRKSYYSFVKSSHSSCLFNSSLLDKVVNLSCQ